MERKRSVWSQDQQQDLENIVNKKAYAKSEEELNLIDDQIYKIEFVANLKAKLQTKQYYDFLRELKVEKCSKLSKVIEYGDMGRKFYILVFGDLLVLTPNKTDLLQDMTDFKLTPDINNHISNEFPNWHIQGKLKPGQSFGEIALMYDQCRTATVLALNHCLLLSLSRDAYKKIIETFQKKLYSEKLSFLQSSSLFKSWEVSALSIILYDLPTLEFTRGQKIYSEGDPTDSIYLVKEGEIQINKTLHNIAKKEDIEAIMLQNQQLQSQWNEETLKCNLLERTKQSRLFSKSVQIAIIGERECFGEEEVYNSELKRLHTAICFSQKTVLFRIKKQKFLDNLPNNDSLVHFLVNEKSRDTQRSKLVAKATQIASSQMTRTLSVPKFRLQLPENQMFFKLKKSMISPNQSMTSINSTQLKSPSSMPSFSTSTNRVMLKIQELSSPNTRDQKSYSPKEPNNLFPVNHDHNIGKKHLIGRLSQEDFIKSMIKEKLKLREKVQINHIRTGRVYRIVTDNSQREGQKKQTFKNSSQEKIIKLNVTKPSKLQQIIIDKYFLNK